MRIMLLVAAASASLAVSSVAQSNPLGMPPASREDLSPAPSPTSTPTGGYDNVNGADRVYYEAPRLKRGTSTAVPEADVIRLCSDRDGCQVRIGMHDWDNTQRVASREFVFFYNKINKNWRSSYGDAAGTNADNVVQHVATEVWACYFTDGEYTNWTVKDASANFGLLSWNQYNADCWMTIID